MSIWTKTVAYAAAAVAGASLSTMYVVVIFFLWHIFEVIKGMQ